jgi:formylglycine-generating enzyme required for sulfatase activity
MSDFFKKFLLEDLRRLGPSGRYVALAAFGKHPGWDDHLEPTELVTREDLGLETESLNLAKMVLYVNGIGGQIDSGVWEKLDTAQQLPAFRHLFVWQRAGQFLIGRMWSSSDGKGRKRYPLVVCLHFVGVTLGWALKQALPTLAELESEFLKATSAEEVRALLNRKRAALREVIQSTDGRGEFAPVPPEQLHKILPSAGDARTEGFYRVLYQIQSQLGGFAAGTGGGRANPATLRAQQIRVPAAAESHELALLFWTRFFLTQVDASVPLLMTLPLDAGWVDVTVGEPESHEFFCLRASPKAVPLVSEVPYQLDDAFRAKAMAFLDGFKRGETAAADLRPAAAPAIESPAPAKGGWMKWLGVGGVAIIGVVAVKLLLPKDGKEMAATTPSGTSPVVAKLDVTKPEITKPAVKPEVKPVAKVDAAPAADPAKTEAALAKVRKDAQVEAARLAEEKRKSDAMAAAAKLKVEAEAAANDRERQLAESARLAREKAAAAQKELEEQQRKTAEAVAAKLKAEEEQKARAAVAATTATNPPEPKPPVTSSPPAATVSGETTNSIGMVLVPLPSGLWVGKFEVTQAEYTKVMGMENNPSKSKSDPQHDHLPVERVTWKEANDYCRKLTELEQGKLPAGKVYTLPTEKQWKDFAGDQKFEDIPGGVIGRNTLSVVGQSTPPNRFGLFDVLGNVWEWCLDGATGDEKLLKGGAFNSANYDRTLLPETRVSNCGFRCVVATP